MRGGRVVWRYVLPLAVDLILAGVAWVAVPTKFETPMATISLFAPDVFLIIVLLTALSIGLALARSILVFRTSPVTRSAGPLAGSKHPADGRAGPITSPGPIAGTDRLDHARRRRLDETLAGGE